MDIEDDLNAITMGEAGAGIESGEELAEEASKIMNDAGNDLNLAKDELGDACG